MKSTAFITASISLSLILGTSCLAADLHIENMMKMISARSNDPQVHQQSIMKGKERATLCNQCHGADGNSVNPDVPNLAGQNPVYLLGQIEKFANGSRKNFVMNALAKNFTQDDKINLAMFYASLTVKPGTVDTAKAARGADIYKNTCSGCHGEKGIGKADFARLAGQQVQYVEQTLIRFRQNAVSGTGSDTQRQSNVMESITRDLSNDDIEVLAAYIAQLQ